jgi:hypothetical protein
MLMIIAAAPGTAKGDGFNAHDAGQAARNFLQIH